jgi:hypothetical protein
MSKYESSGLWGRLSSLMVGWDVQVGSKQGHVRCWWYEGASGWQWEWLSKWVIGGQPSKQQVRHDLDWGQLSDQVTSSWFSEEWVRCGLDWGQLSEQVTSCWFSEEWVHQQKPFFLRCPFSVPWGAFEHTSILKWPWVTLSYTSVVLQWLCLSQTSKVTLEVSWGIPRYILCQLSLFKMTQVVAADNLGRLCLFKMT